MTNKNFSSKTKLVGVVLMLSLSLGACSKMKSLSGVGQKTPDEFRVLSKPPLVMPPDYNLRPPKAGVSVPQQLSPSAQAINALFPGRTTLPPPASEGEKALVKSMGGNAVSANIRSVVSGDKTIMVEKGELLKDVLQSGELSDSPDGSHIIRNTAPSTNDSGK